MVLAVLASVQAALAAETPSQVHLSVGQQRTLLREAIATCQSAGDEDQAYATAAEKFQLLVDSGIENDQLYFNLATAQLQSGQHGRAIANYRRALRIDPASELYRNQLAVAEKRVVVTAGTNPRIVDSAQRGNDVLLRFVGPRAMIGISIAAWAAFWCILVLRTIGVQFYWKSAAAITLGCAVLAAGSYLLRVTPFLRNDVAVLTSDAVSVREGDGEEFAEITKLTAAEGRVVEVLDRRGGWLRIGLQSGTAGWVRADESETIRSRAKGAGVRLRDLCRDATSLPRGSPILRPQTLR